MDTSSPRFKSFAVTAGLSFWFFIITQSIGIFSIEILVTFVTSILIITQIFAKKNIKRIGYFCYHKYKDISWNFIWYFDFNLWDII